MEKILLLLFTVGASLISPIAAAAFSGYYEIVNINCGMVLEVYGSSATDGAPVDQYRGYGDPKQQWSIVDDVGGIFEIINRNSGKALASNLPKSSL